MLEYDKIDINEGIDINKNISISKRCWLCGYWYFIDKNFNYQKYMCHGCHDISLKAISLHNLCIGYIMVMRIELTLHLCLKMVH